MDLSNEIVEKLTKDGKIIPARINQNFLNKIGLLQKLNMLFDETYSISEKIFLALNRIKDRPKCYCGNPLKYKSGIGYGTFCSRKCSSKNPDILIRNKKSVSSSLLKAYSERGENIKRKRSETIFKRFGQKVNTPFKIDEIKEKIKSSIKEKFGVENIFSLQRYRSNNNWTKERSKQNWKKAGYDIEYLNNGIIEVSHACSIHDKFEIDIINFYNRSNRGRHGIICPICNPINSFSSFELEFSKILESNNIKYEKNRKDLIPPYEIDFYLPEYSIGIELNGIYWHSNLFKEKYYHKDKLERSLRNNINLIQIWEDDFYERKDSIISLVLNKLSIYKKVINPENCHIKIISSDQYLNFLCDNSIELCNSECDIKIGLFNEDELICIMGLNNLDDVFILKNLINKNFYNIPGGEEKLLSHFSETYHPKEIITYINTDYFDPEFYYKLGFILDKKEEPIEYFLEGNKKILSNSLNEINNKIRIFNSGKLKLSKKFKE